MVAGENDSLSIVQQDLDVIGKVLNRNFILKHIMRNSPATAISYMVIGGGLMMYISEIEKVQKYFENNPQDIPLLGAGMMGITIVGILANELFGRLMAKHYISKLSDKGKKYHFGYDAEAKLGKELADKGVEKSGLYLPLAISRAFGEYT